MRSPLTLSKEKDSTIMRHNLSKDPLLTTRTMAMQSMSSNKSSNRIPLPCAGKGTVLAATSVLKAAGELKVGVRARVKKTITI